MSDFTIRENTGNKVVTDYNTAKVFFGNNRYQKGNYLNNSSYDPITLKAGTVLGRITASNILAPLQSNASDGSQLPVGILADEVLIVEGGDTVQISMVDMGDLRADQLIFVKPGDGLETVVSSRRLKDHLAAQGMKLVIVTGMSGYDA